MAAVCRLAARRVGRNFQHIAWLGTRQVPSSIPCITACVRPFGSTVSENTSGSSEPATQAKSWGKAAETIWVLSQGNKRYLAQRGRSSAQESQMLVEQLIEDPLRPANVKAILLTNTHTYAPLASMFDAEAGELQVLRVSGHVCSPQDPIVGSVEFLLTQVSPPVVLILGSPDNDVVLDAVAVAMMEAGRSTDLPKSMQTTGQTHSAQDLALVQQVMHSAKDALQVQPHASFEKLAEIAAQLHVWETVETLVTSSKIIADGISAGIFEVHGALASTSTGRVQFLGQHPSLTKLLRARPASEQIRTAADPPLPAEEALAVLYTGNRRYAAGKGGQTTVHDKNVLRQLSTGGQNPIAVVFGCADSRAPIEILFDMRPGDLFVLRNAGNTCTSTGACGLIGSAEYAISQLHSKLIVVTGHTKCGAVTAAVNLAVKHRSARLDTNIGTVLGNIMTSADEAVKRLPDASMNEIVKLATELHIFDTMEKMVQNSGVIREGVVSMDLQVHGAVYDLFTGKVEWLGQHPNLENIVQMHMPLHRWKVHAYESLRNPGHTIGRSQEAKNALEKLREGNWRFITGETEQGAAWDDPYAIVVGGAGVRLPIEKIFDVPPGAIMVQRIMGGFEMHERDTLCGSLEYAVVRYTPDIIVILVESHSQIVDLAFEQINGAEVPSAPMRRVLSDVMVSALRAVQQVSGQKAATAAGETRKINQLTVELSAFHSIEQLLRSQIIRSAVIDGALELHAAVLLENTGEVAFLGEHPMLNELINQAIAEAEAAEKAAIAAEAETSEAED